MAMACSALFRGRIGGRAARISTCKVAEAEAFSPQRGASRLVVLNRVTAWNAGAKNIRDVDRPCTKRTGVQRWRSDTAVDKRQHSGQRATRIALEMIRWLRLWCADGHALPFRPAAKRLPHSKIELGAPGRPAAFCVAVFSARAGASGSAGAQHGLGARAEKQGAQRRA
jgi:hypothetical protein